jgi:hypothetical protein
MNMDRRNFLKKATVSTVGAVVFAKDTLSASLKVQETRPRRVKENNPPEPESQDSRKIAQELLEEQYKQLYELTVKENKVRGFFGDFYQAYKANEYDLLLSELEVAIVSQLDQGKKAENISVIDIVNQPFGSPETDQTPKTTVEALNTKDGPLSKERFEQILETYPKGWVYNEIGAFQINNFNKAMTYKGTSGNTLADSYPDSKYRIQINFYKIAEKQEGKCIVRTIGHEVAHTNDWCSDNEMTALERAALILKVYQRMLEKDHFKSSYVESINEDDKKENDYYKTREYWAVICEEYFADPNKLNKKDFDLVDAFVKKTDPTFDVMAAKKKRENLTPGFKAEKRQAFGNTLIDIENNVTRMVDRTMEDGSRAIVIEPVSKDDPLFHLARREYLERNGYEVA